MAAILTIARRIARMQQFRFARNPFLQSAIANSFSRSSSSNLSSFSSAFHRTGSVRSRLCTHFLRRISLKRLSTQINAQVFDFPSSETQNLIPPDQRMIDLIRRVALLDSEAHAMASLEDSSFHLNHDSLYSLIWEFRDEWRLAFLAFKWGERCGRGDKKSCELMVWVLGNHQKFNIAWCLIRDMFHGSTDTRNAMFLMMDRYAAANDTSQAIRTFDVMDKFRHTPDEEAFRGLLYALCRHGHIEEAEQFMLANKKLFPVDVEGFNIVLNGWCNIWVDVTEAKRIWREMGNYCIEPNKDSYGHMISCYSKVGNLFESLRLYDEMKKRGWSPDVEVYNSLAYVLTRENCFDEALKLVEKMKESGLKPNSVTYNSMIRPLCEAKKLEEARNVLATMINENLSLTIDTFHSFLEIVDYDRTLEVLNEMKIAGLGPKGDTFLLILRNLFKEKQPENVLNIWAEMARFDIVADPTLYLAMVQGLVTCGWLAEAREIYSEMKSKGLSGDPKLEKLLQKPVRGNVNGRKKNVRGFGASKMKGLQKQSSRESYKRQN
ncbi:PREDICTED: pentatricopeptide repeat-containing protein At1g80880, mitochondrial [Tarenaya hassleriana]|uniref:pentatricopeptide repeat-containing protein At1g80880, mitochondrial n=1 Tax=Tarenaya hassleriana TaxID=28532 RepID=UPI00053C0DB5|nr:PREDICTED: pentatricopeptide repeat-containing protein At1g80880, mitochondrial [Tarenaya hassleriana]